MISHSNIINNLKNENRKVVDIIGSKRFFMLRLFVL